MENTIIVYRSATGFTRKYAERLAALLDCSAIELREATVKRLRGQRTILFGSRIHAGRMDGLRKFKRRFAKLEDAQLILFLTGGTPAEAEEVIASVWKNNLSPAELHAVPHFYLPGGLCYERMSLPDRLLMKLAAKMMSRAEPTDPVQAGFAKALTASYDLWDEKYLLPLTDFLQTRES